MRWLGAVLDRRGIAWKLAVPIVGVLLLAMGLSLGVILWRVGGQVAEAEHQAFVAQSESLARVVERSLARDSEVPVQEIEAALARIAERGLAAYALIVRPDGSVLASYGAGLALADPTRLVAAPRDQLQEHGASRTYALEIDGRRFVEVVTPIEAPEPVRLQVAHTEQSLWQAALLGVVPALIAVVAGVLATLAVVVLAARSLRQRLDALQARVAGLAAGEFPAELADQPRDELGRLSQAFSDMVGTLRDRDADVRRLTEELRDQAERDWLTGLLNHGAIENRIWRQLNRASETEFAVVAIDVDNFRLVNETHGHMVGDRVLRWVGQTCRAAASSHDSVGRYAADQFVVLLRDCTELDVAAYVARVRSAVTQFQGTELGATDFSLSLSFGVARYPADGRTPAALLARSDSEVYRARFGVTELVEHSAADRQNLAARIGEGFDTLAGLVAAVDAKDDYTMRHSELVATYATLLAVAQGCSDETERLIRIAGIVHDVGKVAVPDAILKKPGRLTDAEMEAMRAHVELSETLVTFAIGDRTIIEAVAHHHERWDGKGYPRGLTGEDVPIIGRIMIIADAMSAMTIDRPYRRAMSIEQALAEIEAGAGTQFDADLAPIFVQAVRRWQRRQSAESTTADVSN